MKRLIHHDELARDSRFIRQDNVIGTIMASLPDDVDAVVEAFEKMEPMIEQSVLGTAAEPLFEEYGPAFPLITNNTALMPDDPVVEDRLKMRMHGILVGEMQALEGAGRSLWDFPEAPWDFKMNMARQCWDEARHVQIYEKLLEHVGGEVGMYAESTFLFECCCADDPALRVAGVNRGLEGLACDVFREILRFAELTGDEVTHQAVDYVLADELTHVRFGSEWVREFTRKDPDRLQRAQDFRREVDKRFNFGGARSAEKGAAIPIAWEDRREAGFSEEELEELAALTSEGPQRATIRKATELLKQRYEERKRGMQEAAG